MADSSPHEPVPRRALDPVVADSEFPRRATDAQATPRARGRGSRRARRIEQGHRSFGRAVGWTILGALVPGAGLWNTRQKAVGIAMSTVTVLTVALVGVGAWKARAFILSLLVNPTFLLVAAGALVVLGVAWVSTLVVAHLSFRPLAPPVWQRVSGTLLVGLLSMAVAIVTFASARTAYDSASFVEEVFTPAKPPSAKPTASRPPLDPWAETGRLNVLVLGGDSGRGRREALGARTDTVITASIDTKTGDTVLFSLPRQTGRIPFPPDSKMARYWPNGFTDGNPDNAKYFLNSIYDNVPGYLGKDVVGDVKDPGAEVLKQAVGTALGLDIDYYVMVNMDGFVEFVDALGGITVNINKPIAMGGVTDKNILPDRWLEPGPDRHLNGREALWYARGRFGTDDYERMQRQRCVVQAVAQQASPITVLANYEAILKSGRDIITTDVPSEVLPAMMELALKVKGKPFQSVSFENGRHGFSTVYPNWELVRGIVQEAITNPPEPSPTETPTPSESPSASETDPSPSASPSPTETKKGPIKETADECGYNPVKYDPSKG